MFIPSVQGICINKLVELAMSVCKCVAKLYSASALLLYFCDYSLQSDKNH